jgi:hypothetical protein
MTALPPPFPLCWPDSQRRTASRERSQFRTKLDGAVKNVRESLRLFGADSGKAMGRCVVTMNATAFDDGAGADPGVAVWFEWDGAVRCMAVDRYASIAENLQAIHHVLEARRVELRHAGIEMARTTFKGFLALPAPPGSVPWHQVLGVSPNATADEISAARKRLAREHSSDEARMAKINVAHDEGMKSLG